MIEPFSGKNGIKCISLVHHTKQGITLLESMKSISSNKHLTQEVGLSFDMKKI